MSTSATRSLSALLLASAALQSSGSEYTSRFAISKENAFTGSTEKVVDLSLHKVFHGIFRRAAFASFRVAAIPLVYMTDIIGFAQ